MTARTVPFKYCEVCEGLLRSDNRYGVCQRKPACRAEYDRRRWQCDGGKIKESNNRWRQSQGREYFRDKGRKWRTSLSGKSSRLLSNARRRAREKGIPFDLTREWVETELENALENGCPYLGIPIILDGGTQNPNCPSIEQFNPGGGYTQANCLIVSHRANVLKRDGLPGEIEALGDSVGRLSRTRFRDINDRHVISREDAA